MSTRCNNPIWSNVYDAHKLPALLTTVECANLLRVSEVTVRKWCRSGKIKAIHIGDVWRIDKESLLRGD